MALSLKMNPKFRPKTRTLALPHAKKKKKDLANHVKKKERSKSFFPTNDENTHTLGKPPHTIEGLNSQRYRTKKSTSIARNEIM